MGRRLPHLPRHLLATIVMVVAAAQQPLCAIQAAAALTQAQFSVRRRLFRRVLARAARVITRYVSRVGAVLRWVGCQPWLTRTHIASQWKAGIEHASEGTYEC